MDDNRPHRPPRGRPPTPVTVREIYQRLRGALGPLDPPRRLDPLGDGQEVEHRVGRAAERHRHRDGVLERLTCEDLPRPDAQPRPTEPR